MGATQGNIIAIKAFSFGADKTWDATTDDNIVAQTVTVPGLQIGDVVLVRKPTQQTDLSYNPMAIVTAVNTLSIQFIANGSTPTATANEEWTGYRIKSELPVSNNPTI
jgi:hypothetical protein